MSADDPIWLQGLALLARRPRTRSELREGLLARDHVAESVESTIERLERAGYLDDEALAVDYIVTRAARLGHGPRKLVADLVGRGVPEDVAQRAWSRAVRDGGLAPDELLRAQIARRVREQAPLEPRAFARVYNALLRAGFDAESVRSELEAYRGDHDLP